MERETFDKPCRILRGDLTRQETRLRKPVSVEKCAAVGVSCTKILGETRARFRP